MAGTDITGLLEAVQKKINAVDSSASTGDLLRLLSAVRQSGTPSVFSYNGDEFPNLLDGTDDLQMLAYSLDSDKLYFQKDRWLAKVTVPIFQGTNFGYASGADPTGTIDKFPFASDANATDVGDLSVARAMIGTGQSSTVSGYSSGGFWASNVIDKFPFASDANATDVGDMTVGRGGSAGQSSARFGYGYITGGMWIPPGTSYNIIEKFSFSADGNSTDVGDLTLARNRLAGQSSNVSGYSSGGLSPDPSGTQNTIDKFPFAADANATDVGDLTVARGFAAGQSSQENGYITAGDIQKFPFASDANATITGDLTATLFYSVTTAGQSSTSNGYASGSPSAEINKFSFASDGNASNIGSLTVGRDGVAGQQY
jgi:hypothetical protein